MRPGGRALRLPELCRIVQLLSVAIAGCRDAPAPPPEPPPPTRAIDVHVHLTSRDAAAPLVERMLRQGIETAVILSSPSAKGEGRRKLQGREESNAVVLEAAAAHPGRLIPFITLDLAEDRLEDLDRWLTRGACGVKLYEGHQDFHGLPLDDPAYGPLLRALEERRTPVLMHVNTARYQVELDRMLNGFPALSLVCAHFCGSRTNLGRLEDLLSAHPTLLVDTSSGSAGPSADGFAAMERDHARLVGLIERESRRFLFGSDLSASPIGPGWQEEWDFHWTANLGLLRAERFAFWRKDPPSEVLTHGQYRGLALAPALLRPILEENARRWLAPCLSAPPAGQRAR
jgi:uncharacterized protein